MSAAEKKLRISATVVTTEGRSELKSNDQRIERARELIRIHVRQTDLIVLPAGFLRARREDEVPDLVKPIIAQARTTGIAVIIGVDAGTKRSKAVQGGSLPYFLVGWSPGMKRPTVWRQRSITSADAGDAPDAAIAEERSLEVAGARVAPLVCGEVFNPRIREAIAKLEPRAAVLAAHTAAGARHWAGQRVLARLGVPSVRSVHVAGEARVVMCSESNERHPRWKRFVKGITATYFEV